MIGKNYKMTAISSLRTKILQLRNQLQKLQKVELHFSPIKSNKGFSQRKSIERLATPKSMSRKTTLSSTMREYVKNKSKQRSSNRQSDIRHDLSKSRQDQIRQKYKNKTMKLDLAKLRNGRQAQGSQKYETIIIPLNLSRSTSRSISNQSFSRTSTKKCLRFEDQVQTPRFQRRTSIKTYKLPLNNPILNPPIQKVVGRKMFAQKNQSPKNIYCGHNRSNPNMFLSYHNSQIIMPTRSRQNRKNISQLSDCSPPETIKSRYSSVKSFNQKRHLSKHFNENDGSVVYRK